MRSPSPPPSDPDDRGTNPTPGPTLGDLVALRLSRRTALGAFAAAAGAILLRPSRPQGPRPGSPTTLGFDELPNRIPEHGHAVAAGHRAEVLIRWGDPVLGDAPAFEPDRLTAWGQERQFGYNNDFVAFMPLPAGSKAADRGLLCVNHEYTNSELMWPGEGDAPCDGLALDREQTRVEMAAHGHSVVEIARRDGRWRPVPDSRYNRRLTATSVMRLSGPAAGHRRLRTKADPGGRKVLGTINDCAGGVTPWGTVLIAEENFQMYFGGDPARTPEARNHARYGLGDPVFGWSRHFDRFDVEKEPNEPNRFGWIVELDPYDPFAVPVKRTALGRLKHEGATVVLDADGRVVVYTGDDERFEYVYKFVSHARYDRDVPERQQDLLDDGTLYVARFDADGTLRWLPLVFGTGPLVPDNGFDSQADVLIEARRAADLLRATKMDRPEDVEASPVTGKVYVMLTNNVSRRPTQTDAANPRGPNPSGHVLEMVPPGAGDDAGKARHAALTFRWECFLLAGDPSDPASGARYHPETSGDGWFHAPDNCTFDREGRLWIATDQGAKQVGRGVSDGMRACDTEGPGRALTKLFFACPVGAEMCGPCFTPDDRTLFVSVQHPGEGTHRDGERPSTFGDPSTRWPDDAPGIPPRPAVVAITRADGGPVGGRAPA